MVQEKEKLFAEINDQEIRYAVFKLDEKSGFDLISKKISKNEGIKNGEVIDSNIAIEKISKDLKEIEKKHKRVFGDIVLIVNQKEMSSTNLTSFKKLNGAKVEKRDLDYI